MCPSFPKDPQKQNMDSRADAATAESSIKDELNKFKGSFLEEFKELKTAFFTKVNCFKRQLLRVHKMPQGTSQSSEITRLNGSRYTQPAITCLKLALEQVVKYVQS